MTLKRRYGIIYFECNDCGEESPEFDDDFTVVTDQLRALGWKTTKDQDTKKYEHWCPDCQPNSD